MCKFKIKIFRRLKSRMKNQDEDSDKEFEKKISSSIKESVELISKIKYIDASPKKLKILADRMKEIVLVQDKDEKIVEEGKKIQKELNEINIVLEQDEKITIEEFNKELSKSLSPEIIKSLEISPKNLMNVSPFKELGLVPIGKGKFPRIKDIYHPIVSKSTQDSFRSGNHDKSNSFFSRWSKSWYWTPSPFVYCNAFFMSASTKTYAAGFDAADPQLQEACRDPNNPYNYLACILAYITERRKFYSYRIKTEVWAKHLGGPDDDCSRNRYNVWKCETPNDWEPGHCWDPGVFFWAWEGVRSRHRIWLFSNYPEWRNTH